MNRRLPFLAALVLAASGSWGCTHATLEVSRVPNPVLLGPIDRIGGHRAVEARVVASIDDEVSDHVVSRNKVVGSGDLKVSVNETTRTTTSSQSISSDILARTEGRGDRDVRVDRLPVGAWAFVTTQQSSGQRWVGIQGRIVEVGHGR